MHVFLNFSYGSNMLGARIRKRVPSARGLGIACLEGHTLRWHKPGRDGSGKCDVVPDAAPGAGVWGVVHEIACDEKPALDRAEGLGQGYDERLVRLSVAGRPIDALLYIATRIEPSPLPFDWYHALVVAGARQHGLPAAYQATIEAQPTQPDHDEARSTQHWTLSGLTGPTRRAATDAAPHAAR